MWFETFDEHNLSVPHLSIKQQQVGKGPIVLAPALWTLFLSLLPHKEERFLAVIFPIAYVPCS